MAAFARHCSETLFCELGCQFAPERYLAAETLFRLSM